MFLESRKALLRSGSRSRSAADRSMIREWSFWKAEKRTHGLKSQKKHAWPYHLSLKQQHRCQQLESNVTGSNTFMGQKKQKTIKKQK